MSALFPALWRKQQGNYFFLATKNEEGEFRSHCFARKDFNKVREFIKNHPKHDVYACPHGFRDKFRRKSSAVPPNYLYADLDEVHPNSCELVPTIALESSPGRFVGYWLVDEPITWELNQRLTYHLGADKGGWDPTQVLRVDGTTNFKYEEEPKVRLLWDNGPVYTIAGLENLLPQVDAAPSSDDPSAALAIYKKYQKKIAELRPMLFREKIPPGTDRSKVLFGAYHKLLSAGLSTDEIYTLISGTVWNKFKNRPDQLRKEIDKAAAKRLGKANGHDAGEMNGAIINFKSIGLLSRERTDWIFHPMLARGELTIIEGDPGNAKSYVMEMLGKAIADGDELPIWYNYSNKPVQGMVLLFDAENSLRSTVKGRLEDNGLKSTDNFLVSDDALQWNDPDHAQAIEAEFEKHRPTLAIFDTMNAFVGDTVNTDRGNTTLSSMRPLKEWAKKYNCSIVVIRHLVKRRGDTRAIHAGQGNVSIGGLARIVISVHRSAEDASHFIMAVVKCNPVGQIPNLMTFDIIEKKDTEGIFSWGKTMEGRADDLVSPKKRGNGGGGDTHQAACDVLRDILGDGPMKHKAVQRAMDARGGFPQTTIFRAAESLGIVKKDGYWSLPEGTDDGPEVQAP